MRSPFCGFERRTLIRLLCRLEVRHDEKASLISLAEAVRIALNGDTREASAFALTCIVSSVFHFVHFRQTTTLQQLQSVLDGQGWNGASAFMRCWMRPNSSWPISSSLRRFRSARIFLGENGVYYTIFERLKIEGKKQNRLAHKGKTARCHAHIYWFLRLYIFPEVQPAIVFVNQVFYPANAFSDFILAKWPSAHAPYLHFIFHMTGNFRKFHL